MIVLTTLALACVVLLDTVYGAWNATIGCEKPCNDINKDPILAGTYLSIRSTGIPENITSYTIFLDWGKPSPHGSDMVFVLGDVLHIERDSTGATTVNVSTPSTIPPGDYYSIRLFGKGANGLFSDGDQIIFGPLTFQKKAATFVPTIPQDFTANLGCYGSCPNNTVHPGDALLATWSEPSNIDEFKDYTIRLSWGNAQLVDRDWGGTLNGGLDTSKTPMDQAPKGVNVTLQDNLAPGSSYFLVIGYTSTKFLRDPTSYVGPFTLASSS